MILYHGSNMSIDSIELQRGRKGKDFGQGFYLTESKNDAMDMAQTAVDREEAGVPTLNQYEFDESKLTDGTLKVKRFEGYSLEWAKFINMNRANRTPNPIHDYDVVYGPIADDKIGLQMWRMAHGYINEKQFEKRIHYIRPTFQYFIGTEKAKNYLKKL